MTDDLPSRRTYRDLASCFGNSDTSRKGPYRRSPITSLITMMKNPSASISSGRSSVKVTWRA